MPLSQGASARRRYDASMLSDPLQPWIRAGRIGAPIAVLALVALLVLGCTGEPAGSGVLSVTNRSTETVYIRFQTAPDQSVTYRVDPGAVGRAENVDPARRPDTMTIYSADCDQISEQSDPALGQMAIETSSTVFTAAQDPAVGSKPLLPIDDRCG
jgi:hypothetical protein